MIDRDAGVRRLDPRRGEVHEIGAVVEEIDLLSSWQMTFLHQSLVLGNRELLELEFIHLRHRLDLPYSVLESLGGLSI